MKSEWRWFVVCLGFVVVLTLSGSILELEGHQDQLESQQAQIDSLKVEAEYEWLNSMQGEINALRYSIDSMHHQHPIDLAAARQRAVEL